MGTHPIFESDFDCLTEYRVDFVNMSAYGLMDQYAKKILKYSTPISNAWWTVNFVFRMFIVAGIGGGIYGDEQGVFRCDTNQPGCSQMCFNRFSPMQHTRFWGFQILFCTLPSVIFIFITANQEAQIKKLDAVEKQFKAKVDAEEDEDKAKNYYSSKEYQKIEKKKKKIGAVKKKTTTDQLALTEVIWTPRIRIWYVVHLIAKFIMELVFIYLFYVLMQQQTQTEGWAAWKVPEKYVCRYGDEVTNAACSQNGEIPCWVSRPREKEAMTYYMLAVAIISTVLIFVEVIWVTTRISVRSNQRKRERRREKSALQVNLLSPPATAPPVAGGE